MEIKKEQILVYAGGFELPDKNAAAHRVLIMGKLLKECGKRVCYIGTNKGFGISSDILETRQQIEGFECYCIPYPHNYREWITYLCSPKKHIKVLESMEKADGVIFYNFPSVAMRRLMRYCKKKQISCYADVTEWYSAKGNGFLWSVIKGMDTWYRMHILHNQMDGMIVISQYLKSYYRKRPRVQRIPVLEDISDAKWADKSEKSASVLKLVYAGQPGKKDRIDFLIEALMSVKRTYRLDIAGITREDYLRMYPQHRDWLKTHSEVSFKGRLPHDETLAYIKSANYSCFFREKNRMTDAGFPTKFAEAVCCGTPVITNETSDLNRFMKKGKNGILIRKLECSKITEAIEKAAFISETDASVFDYRKYRDIVIKIFGPL